MDCICWRRPWKTESTPASQARLHPLALVPPSPRKGSPLKRRFSRASAGRDSAWRRRGEKNRTKKLTGPGNEYLSNTTIGENPDPRVARPRYPGKRCFKLVQQRADSRE